MKILLMVCFLAYPLSVQATEILDQAIGHYENGEYGKTVELLSPEAKSPDASAELKLWLGKAYLKVMEWDKAVEEMKKAVQMKPSNATYHLWLGRAYGARAENKGVGLKDARRLRKEFEKARELSPSNTDIRFDLLEFYIQAPWIVGGSKSKAQKEAEAIAKLNPKLGYTARAILHERKKKWDLAENEYTQATAKYPEDADVHKDLAMFLFSRQKYGKALASARKVLELNSSSKQALFIAAASSTDLGFDLEQAEKDLRKLVAGPHLEGDPAPEEMYYWLGILYHRQGENEKSKAALNNALQIHPGHKKAKQYLKNIQ